MINFDIREQGKVSGRATKVFEGDVVATSAKRVCGWSEGKQRYAAEFSISSYGLVWAYMALLS